VLIRKGQDILESNPGSETTRFYEPRLLCPKRVRRVLHQLSWIDKRLVRVGHISRCRGVEALWFYLLLVTVADSQGLSYYSDKTAARLLGLSEVDCQIRSLHQERGLNFAQIARELHLDHREAVEFRGSVAPRDRQDLFRIRSPFLRIVTSTTFNVIPRRNPAFRGNRQGRW
jgi:hypothetical protein